MHAIILAGGRGTRLRPFTTTIPKPLVPLGDMPIIEISLARLARSGCDRVTLAVGHMAQLIMTYLGDGERWGLSIDYSVEDEPLGTIGPLRRVRDLPANFLVMNGDLLTDLDYGEFFRAHEESGATATVAVYQRKITIDFGVVSFDETSRRVVDFVEKPDERFSVSMGIYAFNRSVLDMLPEDGPFGFDDLMLKGIGLGLDIRAYPYDGYWLDIGRPEDYDRANEDFESMRSRLLGPSNRRE